MKKDHLMLKITGLMPKTLVYWATIQLLGEVTTGKYSNTDPSELNVMEALKRFSDEHPNA